jgi:predicted transcriptional regulator
MISMKYRSRSEIISLILETANKGATRTRIMYGAYLSYSQLKEYLQFLQGKDLLMYEEGTNLYSLTAKGLECLSAIGEMNDMISLTDDKPRSQVKVTA